MPHESGPWGPWSPLVPLGAASMFRSRNQLLRHMRAHRFARPPRTRRCPGRPPDAPQPPIGSFLGCGSRWSELRCKSPPPTVSTTCSRGRPGRRRCPSGTSPQHLALPRASGSTGQARALALAQGTPVSEAFVDWGAAQPAGRGHGVPRPRRSRRASALPRRGRRATWYCEDFAWTVRDSVAWLWALPWHAIFAAELLWHRQWCGTRSIVQDRVQVTSCMFAQHQKPLPVAPRRSSRLRNLELWASGWMLNDCLWYNESECSVL